VTARPHPAHNATATTTLALISTGVDCPIFYQHLRKSAISFGSTSFTLALFFGRNSVHLAAAAAIPLTAFAGHSPARASACWCSVEKNSASSIIIPTHARGPNAMTSSRRIMPKA
jgi:hypothetical protein